VAGFWYTAGDHSAAAPQPPTPPGRGPEARPRPRGPAGVARRPRNHCGRRPRIPAPPFHPAAPRAAGHTRSKVNTHDALSRASCGGVVRPSVPPRPPTAPTGRRRLQKWWGTQAAQPPTGPPPLAPNGAGRMPGRWTPGGPRTRRATHISHPAAQEEHQPGTNAAGMARVTGRTPHQEPQAPYPHHTASGLRSVAGGHEPRETQAPATIGRHHKAEDRGRFPTPSPAQRVP
jgi:hypothetical protein